MKLYISYVVVNIITFEEAVDQTDYSIVLHVKSKCYSSVLDSVDYSALVNIQYLITHNCFCQVPNLNKTCCISWHHQVLQKLC